MRSCGLRRACVLDLVQDVLKRRKGLFGTEEGCVAAVSGSFNGCGGDGFAAFPGLGQQGLCFLRVVGLLDDGGPQLFRAKLEVAQLFFHHKAEGVRQKPDAFLQRRRCKGVVGIPLGIGGLLLQRVDLALIESGRPRRLRVAGHFLLKRPDFFLQRAQFALPGLVQALQRAFETPGHRHVEFGGTRKIAGVEEADRLLGERTALLVVGIVLQVLRLALRPVSDAGHDLVEALDAGVAFVLPARAYGIGRRLDGALNLLERRPGGREVPLLQQACRRLLLLLGRGAARVCAKMFSQFCKEVRLECLNSILQVAAFFAHGRRLLKPQELAFERLECRRCARDERLVC